MLHRWSLHHTYFTDRDFSVVAYALQFLSLVFYIGELNFNHPFEFELKIINQVCCERGLAPLLKLWEHLEGSAPFHLSYIRLESNKSRMLQPYAGFLFLLIFHIYSSGKQIIAIYS